MDELFSGTPSSVITPRRAGGARPRAYSRRHASLMMGALAGLVCIDPPAAGGEAPAIGTHAEHRHSTAKESPTEGAFAAAAAWVTPAAGVPSRISLGGVAPRMVGEGVIDEAKFLQLYGRSRPTSPLLDISLSLVPEPMRVVRQGPIPPDVALRLQWPSADRIHLTLANADYYLNIFWPLGLANYMSANATGPMEQDKLNRYASTTGWSLGREASGAGYFNRLRIVELTTAQEELVRTVAENSFRPCCDNSTFYQDCNHGSALLGILELGASQGLTEPQLFAEALSFNSFWFPDFYTQTALYFSIVEQTDWADVDPQRVMGYDFSALSRWQANVQRTLQQIPGLLPKEEANVDCSL